MPSRCMSQHILERSLLLDEMPRNCVEELLGENFHQLSAPRVAQIIYVLRTGHFGER
jgi:hypothetical protein